MNRQTRPLADLHQHMYGSIHYMDYLEFVSRREVDWSAYEVGFQAAFGKPSPIVDVLERHSRGEPAALEEFRRVFVFADEDPGNFQRFQAKYDLLIAGSDWPRVQRGEVQLTAAVKELVNFIHKIIARQRQQDVAYSEVRMQLGPQLAGSQVTEVLVAILRACQRYEDTGIEARFALSLPRQDPWPDWEVAREVALGPYGRYLTGIDFCNVEEGHPPRLQQELFAEVRRFNREHPDRGLAILYHVGESFNDKSLESAVRWVHEAAELGAHRLGHAIALGVSPKMYGHHTRNESANERIDQLRYDLRHRDGLSKHGVHIDANSTEEELQDLQAGPSDRTLDIAYDEHRLKEVEARQKYAIERIKALGSVIEVCPTSNRRIGGITDPKHHPLVQFTANDVPFVIGTDDSGIFDTTLANEIRSAIEIAGLPQDAYDEIAERSWSSRSEVLSGREVA